MEAATGHRHGAQSVGLAQHDSKVRHCDVGRSNHHAGAMADDRGLFCIWSDHDPRRVAQRDNWQSVSVTQLDKSGELVRFGCADGSSVVHRVVGDQANGSPFDANQRCDRTHSKFRPQLQHRTFVDHRSDQLSNVVGTRTAVRDKFPQSLLVSDLPLPYRPLKIGQVHLGGAHGVRLVLHQNVDHTVLGMHGRRANLFRLVNTQTCTFDHHRPTHAHRCIPGRDHHITTAKKRRIASKTASGHDTHQRNEPAQTGKGKESSGCKICTADVVRLSRPATAAFGKNHDRPACRLRQLEHSVVLLVAEKSLRAGVHRVVVRRDHTTTALTVKQVTVDTGQAIDKAISRTRLAQLGQRGHAMPSTHCETAVLQK